MLTHARPSSTYIETTSIGSHSEVNVNSFTKRVFDIVVLTIAFVLVLIWLIPLISVLIYLSSPGPIFFVQVRTGKRGQIFQCYKFRTMYVSNQDNFKQAQKNDPRITPIGRLLRKNNLDELPQFLNVLLGNMSLIGPRPHPLQLDSQYWNEIPSYEKRYQVVPGITGLAQAKGARGITDDPLKMKHRVKYDLFYQEHQSLALDLAICWWTFVSMIRANNNAW